MDRRSFLGSILAACAAPAIVRADSLMRIVPRDVGVMTFATQEVSLGFTIDQPDLILCGDSFAEIVAYTFRKHQKEIRDSVIARNAFLRKAIEHGQHSSKSWRKIE